MQRCSCWVLRLVKLSVSMGVTRCNSAATSAVNVHYHRELHRYLSSCRPRQTHSHQHRGRVMPQARPRMRSCPWCRTVKEAALKAVVERVSAMEQQGLIEPWAGSDEQNSIVPQGLEVTAGQITSRKEYPSMDATELQLSNGMRVGCPLQSEQG